MSVEVIGAGDRVRPEELAAFLRRYRDQVILCEGGPHILGELVVADLVDEIFLTLAPQVIGRDGDRLGLVEGIALDPGDARWHALASVRRAGRPPLPPLPPGDRRRRVMSDRPERPDRKPAQRRRPWHDQPIGRQ